MGSAEQYSSRGERSRFSEAVTIEGQPMQIGNVQDNDTKNESKNALHLISSTRCLRACKGVGANGSNGSEAAISCLDGSGTGAIRYLARRRRF
jgi:hypothetical protein